MTFGFGFGLPRWKNLTGGGSPPVTGFNVLSSNGTSYSPTNVVLDSDGTSYTVLGTVLGSSGTSYTPI